MKLLLSSVIVILFIAALAGPRLTSLGTILTVDEPLWHDRGLQFIKAAATAHFAETVIAGHPGVTTLWLVGLTIPASSLFASQAAISVSTILLVVVITYFLIFLWGRIWGSIAGFFIALDPFLLAHSRLVHTDAIQALLYAASLISLIAALEPLHQGQRPSTRYLVVSAVAGGLAVLTKIFGLMVLPTTLAIIAYTWLVTRAPKQIILRSTLLWIGVFLVTVFIAWPALWTDAAGALEFLASRVAIHAEGTRGSDVTIHWWYYLREGFFRLTVPTTLLLPLGIATFFSKKHTAMRRTVLLLIPAGLGYAALMSVSGDKSDRYIIFTLLMFNLAAVAGLHLLTDWIANRDRSGGKFTRLIPLLLIAWLAIDIIRLHPYYLAHYNRLYPIEADHRMGWGEGLEQAAVWVATTDPGASVATYYPRVFQHFYDGKVESLSHLENKDYIILYRAMFERDSTSPETALINKYLHSGTMQPEFVVTINGLPYAWIFKGDANTER